MIRNMDFNIAAAVMILFVFTYFYTQYDLSTLNSKCFLQLLACIFFTSTLNVICDLLLTVSGPSTLLYILYSLYLTFTVSCAFVLTEYTRITVDSSNRLRFYDIINYVIFFLYVLTCIASIPFHFLVKLEGHEVLRGDAYILMYLFSAYYLIFVFVRMIRHFHHLSKRQSRSVIVFVSVTFVGALLQLLVFGDQMLIYFIYAISCLTLLFAFETPDYQKMIKATEELRLNKEKLEESEANLQQALFTAQEASMAKTTFLSNMSHDIRTPMNAIIGYTELAKEHISDKDEVLDCLNTIKSSGDHLLSLINDVLDMSRIESGKMKVELSPCNLSEMINDIELLTKANVDEKNQTYKTIIDSLSHPYVMCDRLRLNQVLINCIGNAVKYTMEGGHIEVSLTERNSAIEGSKEYIFKVTDNGIGMSDEFLKHVFEPFERAKDSTASSIQGTGLGMAITQNLTQMMGGSITVESELGQGSTFIITLPLTVISAEEYTSSKDTVDDNTSLDDKTKALSGKRVLVVDDNKINRTVVKRLLGERGLLIDECDCGEKAIEIVSNMTTNMYDVIFMDIKMPTMDGYETTDAIRNLDSDIAKTIPIIAMTANAFEEDKNMAMSHGMNGHVTKPFKIEELITFLYTKLCSD